MASYCSSRQVTVRNPQGLHLRAANMIVQAARQFESTVEIIRGEEQSDGKSILSLLTLGAEQETQLLVRTDGPDAEEALTALVDLFARGFDEMPASEAAKNAQSNG